MDSRVSGIENLTFKLGAVFERGGNEGGAHRVCRVTAIEAEDGGMFSDHAIDPPTVLI
jgi:hypothetical protein